jgi:hypothetical protein
VLLEAGAIRKRLVAQRARHCVFVRVASHVSLEDGFRQVGLAAYVAHWPRHILLMRLPVDLPTRNKRRNKVCADPENRTSK